MKSPPFFRPVFVPDLYNMFMKIAIIADVHLNKSTYGQVKDKEHSHLPFRTVDFMRAFEYSVDKAIALSPDFLVVVGDTFDNHYPNNDVSGFLNKQLKKLKDAKVTTVLMVGNHDVCKKHHALKPLKELELEFAKIIDSPTMMEAEDYILVFFPYSLDIEQDKITTKKQFLEFIDDVKQEITDNPSMQNKKVLFFGHFGVQGATMNQYSDKPSGLITEQSIKRIAKRNFRNFDGTAITVDELDNIGASYVFLGDYHKHQVLPTKTCKSMYVGSIEKADINEMGQKKGFVFFDDSMPENERLGACRFVEYPNSRPFVELRGNWSEIKNAAKNITEENNGAIVKISFVGNRQQLIECHAQLQKLKDWLNKKITPIHIMYEQDVIDEQEKKEASEVEEQILQTGKINASDILNVAIEMIDETEKDVNENTELKTLATDIYNEVIGKK